MQKIIKYLGLFLIITFCVCSVLFSIIFRSLEPQNELRNYISYSTYFEDRFFDFRQMYSLGQQEKVMEKRLVMADIDDYSIKGLGSWPLERQHWGSLIRKLKLYGAKVIAFDVFFGEESKSCNGFNPDNAFAKAIEDFHEIPNNRVILPYNLFVYGTTSLEETPEDLYAFAMSVKSGGENYELAPTIISNSVYPFQKLIDTQASLGYIEASADFDGIMRHYKTVANIYQDIYVPSYGLSAYMHFIGEMDEDEEDDNEELVFHDKNVEQAFQTRIDLSTKDEAKLVTLKGDMHLNISGETKVRWFGGAEIYPRIPIFDIISKPDSDIEMHEKLNGTLVFVGSSAFGAHDLRHTPVDPMLPGVYFHMNFVKMLLEGAYFKSDNINARTSWIFLIIMVVALLLVQLKANPILDMAIVVALIGGSFYIETSFLIPQGYETKLFFCYMAIIGCYSWNTFFHFYMANKDKEFLKDAFSSYISPELIDEMYESNEPPKLGGDSGIRTAFFTDIQGFSTFSEKLTPTKLVELLNEYLTEMTNILLEEKGTLDKYEGDAIIAFFGAPMPLEDHAKRACIVAHKMQERLGDLRLKWTKEGEKWPVIVRDMRMRVGINTGEIVTGNMGSFSRMNYTMIGDSVNLAARLEESAKQYGIFTQASKETMAMAGDEFLWRELDTIKVVGKSIPVTTFDLLGLNESVEEYLKDLAIKFKQGIECYKLQQWDEALVFFKQTLEHEHKRYPELKDKKTNPSKIYIERCEHYKENPPDTDWDGVYTLTSK